jgi:hypothetical protein
MMRGEGSLEPGGLSASYMEISVASPSSIQGTWGPRAFKNKQCGLPSGVVPEALLPKSADFPFQEGLLTRRFPVT